MKIIIKSISIILSTVILCLSLFGFTNNSLSKVKAIDLEMESKAIEEDKIESEQKVFSKATIDEDFADDSVIVVFKKSISDYSRIFTTKDFSEVKCKSIDDLTRFKREHIAEKKAEKIASLEKTRGLSAGKIEISDEQIIKENNIDVDNFQNMICLKLEEKGKDKVLEAIKILEKREDVIYVGPNYLHSLCSETTTELPKVTPNDEYYYEYNKQWAIDNIQLPEAWAITTGSSGVLVGVIDSGINKDHPDLQGRVSETLSFDLTKGTIADAFIDEVGHGTHIAGIIGANGDNEIGIAGAAWGVTLVSLKTTRTYEDGSLDSCESALVAAINYAEYRGIKILSYSSEHIYKDAKPEDMVNSPVAVALRNYTGLFVCAVGNGSLDLDKTFSSPASYTLPNLIKVTSHGVTNDLASYVSSSPSKVDLAAPGEYIYSTVPDSFIETGEIRNNNAPFRFKDTIEDGYTWLCGTSQAAPYVASVAALMMSVNPNLTTWQIKEIILSEVDEIDIPDYEVLGDDRDFSMVSGGKLNAYKAVNASKERLTDYYAPTTSGGRAFYDNGTPWFSTSHPGRVWPGDINGDGRTDLMGIDINGDICYSIANSIGEYGAQGKITGSYGLSPDIDTQWFLGSYNRRIWVDDVNGDGYDDFMLISVGGSMVTMMNNGNMTFSGLNPSYTGNAFSSSQGWFNTYYSDRVWTGDVDGNGYADFIGISPTGSVYCALGDGEGNFGNPITITMQNAFEESWFSPSYRQRIWFEDVNGDGKDDFIGVSVSGDIYVSLNNVNLINGNYTFSAPTNKGSSPFLTSSGWFSTNYTSRVWPADVNGDNKLDLVGIDTDGDIIIAMNNGVGTDGAGSGFIQIEIEAPNGYNSSYFTSTGRQRVWACDIDGDGKSDFVGVNSQGYIYSSRQIMSTID